MLADVSLFALPAQWAGYVAILYAVIRGADFLWKSYAGRTKQTTEDFGQLSDKQDGFINNLLQRIDQLEKREGEREESHRQEVAGLHSEINALKTRVSELERENKTLREVIKS